MKYAVIFVVIFGIFYSSPLFASLHYSVSVIPSPNSSVDLTPRAINDEGDVVATASSGSNNSSFLYHDGSLIKLVAGNATNAIFAGAIAGNTDVGAYVRMPETSEPVYFHNGTEHVLPDRGEGAVVAAGNEAGTLVGYVNINGQPQAASWEDGKLTVLTGLAGVRSFATAISDKGEIIGSYTTAVGTMQAFSYVNGVARDISVGGYSMTIPASVNPNGDVVGVGKNPSGTLSNFAIISGRAVPLLGLPGAMLSDPTA